VVERGGQPLAGTRVNMVAAGNTTGPVGGGVAGDDGTFRLSGLAEGRYTLSARKDGYVAYSQTVEIPASGPVDITLQRGGTISGRVRGVDPSQLPAVMISAYGSGNAVSARADANGNFTLQGMPDGRATVTAVISSPRRRSVQKDIDVAGGAATVDLEFTDSGDGFTVRGRVTGPNGALRGGGVSFSPHRAGVGGPGVGGMVMSIGGSFPGTAVIGADGAYEVSGLSMGSYDVRVDGAGGPVFQTSYNVTGNGTFDIEVRGSGLQGRVVDSRSGAPLGDVVITLLGGSQSRMNRELTSDSDGRFSAEVVPAGAYRLRALRDRYATVMQDVTVTDAAPASVEIRMEPAAPTVVRTFDAQTSRPIDAFVGVVPQGAQDGLAAFGTRGEVGETRLYLAPGQYRARASARGYVMQQSDFTAPAAEVRIGLMPAGSVLVVAHSARFVRITLPGSPRPIWGPAPPPTGPIETLAAGVYALDVFDEARHNVVKTYTFTVVAGQSVTVEIE
jgi:hypothetical protein